MTISVLSRAAEDAVGNGNFGSSLSVDKTVTVDKKMPTPTIAAVSGTKSSAFPITINFDEDVSNFGLNSILVFQRRAVMRQGTASNIVSMGQSSCSTRRRSHPVASGTLRISVSAGAAEDDAGNTSVASMNVDVSVDTEGATPTITAPTDTQNGAFDVTIDFGEDVTGFTPSGVSLMSVNAIKASVIGNPVRRRPSGIYNDTYADDGKWEDRHGDDRCRSGCCPRCG